MIFLMWVETDESKKSLDFGKKSRSYSIYKISQIFKKSHFYFISMVMISKYES